MASRLGFELSTERAGVEEPEEGKAGTGEGLCEGEGDEPIPAIELATLLNVLKSSARAGDELEALASSLLVLATL